MKVRVIKNKWYPTDSFKIGEIYDAYLAENGRDYMVFSEQSTYLCMFPSEVELVVENETTENEKPYSTKELSEQIDVLLGLLEKLKGSLSDTNS